jgi:hypothetical protein
MKILCKVNGKPAIIAGFAPGRKGRPMVVVITQGVMKAVRLKDIDLDNVPQDLGKVVNIKNEAA